MNNVIDFKDRKEKIDQTENRKKELLNNQEKILNKMDDLSIDNYEWLKLVNELQENKKEYRKLNNSEEDDDDIEIDFSNDIKAKNEALAALNNARANGIEISDEDYEAFLKL